MWLGAFVERETGLVEDPERRARFHVWDGECHVHAGIRPEDIARTRAENPEAEFLIHPECGCSTQAMEYVAAGDIDPEGVHMLSTSGMLEHVEAHPDGSFIVATENGMLYPLQQAAPRANLIEANRMAFCKYMKMITLPKLRDSLRGDEVRGQRPGRDRRAGAAADRAHGRDRLARLGGVLRGRRGEGVTLCPQKLPRWPDRRRDNPVTSAAAAAGPPPPIIELATSPRSTPVATWPSTGSRWRSAGASSSSSSARPAAASRP